MGGVETPSNEGGEHEHEKESHDLEEECSATVGERWGRFRKRFAPH